MRLVVLAGWRQSEHKMGLSLLGLLELCLGVQSREPHHTGSWVDISACVVEGVGHRWVGDILQEAPVLAPAESPLASQL